MTKALLKKVSLLSLLPFILMILYFVSISFFSQSGDNDQLVTDTATFFSITAPLAFIGGVYLLLSFPKDLGVKQRRALVPRSIQQFVVVPILILSVFVTLLVVYPAFADTVASAFGY